MQRQATPCASIANRASAHQRAFRTAAMAALIIAPCLAMAQAGGAGDLTSATCGVLGKVKTLLNAVSIIVVTIAVIFSGYQIAFAHKRIGDVAPVFIGGLLIGAAGQIANMLIATNTSDAGSGCTSASLAVDPLTRLADVVQALGHYA
ncbi:MULTISPECIES: TrbC/VirB2 family protein [unclassified Variovorax]|uniref:TrbC/VirB2 family protein n=1 Tax=unclassified Variovorax TaxID=663243 RepID=UPI0025751E28|nr:MULTISPECIES: TrbC/VirB2 family protein [unclassified Variovorax]MDM0090477.1 TrbC/VirB2 family protein [Variovorax sp. J22G40]MDM0147858.1 TrbC/VirB2 family protein [Variovorax sp. J2P1-31]